MTDEFRHRTSLRVRFRDIDAFGHVNNAVFATYVEQARIEYLLDVLQPGTGFERLPMILARLAIDFRAPIFFGDELTVETRVGRIGQSSFSMDHRVLAGAERRLVAEVDTVLVAYDYAEGRPTPVPGAWRDRISAHEGLPSAAAAAAG